MFLRQVSKERERTGLTGYDSEISTTLLRMILFRLHRLLLLR